VSEFEREEEQAEEDMIGDVVSSDSKDSDDDQGGRVAMPTPFVPMPVPVHVMPSAVLVHRWCMRHFTANFWRCQRKKEVCYMVKALCCVCTEHQFKETMRELGKMLNQAGKAWLEDQMEQKTKWALAYDEGGFRYDIMTTNSFESFNRVFTGVRSLLVSGIVEFSFQKCNEYFVKR
jgi:hypothetical protein